MGRCLVVVDDDPGVRDLLGAVLAEEGYHAALYANAPAALAALHAAVPRAIILDVRVDGRGDGWHLLEQVRADPALGSVPVIVMTADAEALRQHAAGLYGDGLPLLAKPFDLDELLSIVQQHIGPPDPV
jgi:CheY-like chemotaxis protein